MEIYKNALVWTLFFVGFLLRFSFVDQQSLWMDEASVYLEAFRNSFEFTWDVRHRLQPQNAPLFPLFISFLSSLFGELSFISFRYFSALVGTLGLLTSYLFSVTYFKDGRKSLIFLCLLAFSSFHIQYSQFVRFYVLLFFLFYLHLYLSLRWFQTKKRSFLFFIFLTSAAGCWTNQLMALSFMVGSLIYINSYGFSFKRLLIFNSFNVLGFLTYMPSYLLYVNGSFKIGAFRSVGFGDIVYMLKTVFFPKHLGPSLLELRYFNYNNFPFEEIVKRLDNFVCAETFLLAIFSLIWIFYFLNFKKIKSEKYIFLGSLLFFCAFLYYKNIPFNDRYFLIFYPFFLILLINNLTILGRMKTLCLTLLFILNIWSCGNYFFNERHHTLNFNKITRHLNSKFNLVSLESSRLFFKFFKPKFLDKKVLILENLANRYEFDSFLPGYIKNMSEATLIHTYRSLLKETQFSKLKQNLEETHFVEEPVKNIDPYFRVFRIKKKHD